VGRRGGRRSGRRRRRRRRGGEVRDNTTFKKGIEL
jgi:hypothetical protein